MSKPALANRYITVSRQVDDKTETVNIVPGQEVPEWAVKLIKPEHLGDPRDALADETDQFLLDLRKTARNEGIEITDEWTKEQLSQAITAVRNAASTHTPLDVRQFGPQGQQAVESESDSSEGKGDSSSEQLKSVDEMSVDELKEEHKRLLGDYPHHALSEDNLRKRVSEARES